MYPRDLQEQLSKWLERKEIIILYGARQVGKTTLITEMLKDRQDAIIYNCERPDVKEILENKNLPEIHLLFENKKIVALDEAQKVADIGTILKLIYDDDTFDQKLIATGSSSFELADKITEPLTGRNVKFRLHPLSIDEIKKKNGWLWIIENLGQLMVYGTYPGIIDLPVSLKSIKLMELSSDYLFRDVLAFDNIRNPSLLRKLLKSLALQLGSQVSNNELAGMLGVSSVTIEKYLDLLEKCFVIFSLSSFSGNLRNEIRKSRKYYFYDLGIRNALISALGSIENRSDIGALWENYCITERLKFNEIHHPGASLYFWRTYDGAEIDLIEDYNGELTAFEFKWQQRKRYSFPVSFINEYNPVRSTFVTKDDLHKLVID
jgi:predicted AAA+ superfamily ATPase